MPISEVGNGDRLLLDTHVWLWASGEAGGPALLRPAALPEIELAASQQRLLVSAASIWEIALKAERGQLLVTGDLRAWIREQRAYPGVHILPVQSTVAIECTRLPRWIRQRDGKEHRDPCDRFIATTARLLNAVLTTCDREILAYARQGHVKAYDARPRTH